MWKENMPFYEPRIKGKQIQIQYKHRKKILSVVGIETRYELDGPEIESRWGGEIFSTRPDRPWGLPNLLHNGYRVIPRGKAAGA
jgi:hypothetical protein